MFRTIEDFLTIWKYESESTQKLLDTLTDASLAQEVTAEGRTIGRLAWHIVTTVHEMVSRTGLEFEGAKHEGPLPTSAIAIVKAYQLSNEAMISAIQNNWTDAILSDEHDMYGERWTVATILQILVFHQIHHRGQLTVLMRQAGLRIPGVYGPTREEWAEFGMEAPEV
ncbi:DinB family protein [Sporosarcina limicola]|uniref:Damage-inducible protein DinB n=1 Tax=Sporosarcina limicola TaxID=34101 RepID=A0A927RDW9_9BACL|nr:DinB family protein [Sporosarcina limicola]MBE1554042.1 putative damage-inducible protein DinB [Sporosarcina limicola]